MVEIITVGLKILQIVLLVFASIVLYRHWREMRQ